MTTFLMILAFAGGYAASIYTWPWLRTAIVGTEAEIASLRARASTLAASIRAAL